MMDPAPDATTLEGSVERVTFYNPENGFSVVRLRARGRREPVAVVGTLPAVQPGERLHLTGRWRTDPRHGAQFRPETAEVRAPTDLDDVVRYLGSGLIRQLGPVLAQRIVATFGDRTLEILDAQPTRVREVPGIGPRRARALAAAWAEHRALRAVSTFLSEHRLDTRYAPRLVAAYGADAPRVLSANPYRLVAEVPGLGFAAADRLGQDLGVRPIALARLQAAVQAALLRASERGHTRQTRSQIAESAAALAGVEADLVDAPITQLMAGGVIAGADGGWGKDLTPGPSPSMERGDKTAHAGSPSSSMERGSGGEVLPPLPGGEGWEEPLTGGTGQLALLRPGGPPPPRSTALTSTRVTSEASPAISTPVARSGRLRIYEPPAVATPVAEDGPGLGLARLVQAEEDLAARLADLAGKYGRQSPAAVDAWLDADEAAGRLSAEQRAAVRGALLSTCFVLTGGPGVGKTTTVRAIVRCLQALGRSVALAAPTGKAAQRLGEVAGAEAKTIHRLLGAGPKGFRHGPREPLPFDSVIVDEASMLDTQLARSIVSAMGPAGQLILVGDADQLPSVGPGQVLRDLIASGVVPSVRLETVFRQAAESRIVSNAHRIRAGQVPLLATAAELTKGIDCVFVPAPAGRIAEVGAEWAADRLSRLTGLTPGEIQTLAPLTRVCQAVNGLLQTRLNPAHGQAEQPHGALPLRVGDRVIQTRNNYDLGVFNGDSGVIVSIQPPELIVDFGDDRAATYGPADLLDLDHAYCLTVHRSQGSEWPGVVILLSSAFGSMLSRNLLYTALTRARRAAVLIGDEAAIATAVAEMRDQNRQTGLQPLLKSKVQGESKVQSPKSKVRDGTTEA